MILLYILVFATILGLSAVVALTWAIRSGQMDDFAAGATSIFDEEEPLGEVTDRFPTEDNEGSEEVTHR